jgi:ribosomal protein L11 methylase PrmA
MQNEMREWIDECKKNPAKKMRIHIVEEPYTPYLEWEAELYKHVHIPVIGEQVFIIPKQQVDHIDIPEGDFMIFDTSRAIQSHYNKKKCSPFPPPLGV